MAPLGGRFSDRIGIRIPATAGIIVISLTTFSFGFMGVGVSDGAILIRQLLLGLGIALFAPANNSAIIGSLPKEKIGLASSFLALSRNLGMVIGIAFAEMIVSLSGTVSSSGLVQGSPSIESLQYVWKSALPIGLMAVLISWTRNAIPPSSRKETLDVA